MKLRLPSAFARCSMVLWLASGCAASTPPPEPPAPDLNFAQIPADEAETERTEEYDPVPMTVAHASFTSSTSTVRPSGKFLVIARFDIHPGYRLGWINPGDAGKRTRVSLKAPDGFEVSQARFPAPTAFDLGDGVVSYGYEQTLAVFFEVKAPPGVQQVSRFDIKAAWLGCKRECVSEETNAFFELARGYGKQPIELEPEVQAQYARLPQPFSSLKDATHAWVGHNELSVQAKGVTWKAFFPASGKTIHHSSSEHKENNMLVQFSESPSNRDDIGVAVAQVGGQERYIAVASESD